MADANETRQVLVKHLETAAVLLRLAGVAEAVWTVQDAGEGVVVDWALVVSKIPACLISTAFGGLVSLTVSAHLSLKLLDLRQRRVLSTRSQEVAQVVQRDAAVAALVEEGEGLLEVCALRLWFRHRVLAGPYAL